jgi:hypothetical protein
MNNKFFGLIILMSVLFLLGIGQAEAVCTIPVENLTINTDTTLCPGTYNLNDTDTLGAIMMNNTGFVTLDCNGTTIIGNNATNSRGISRSTTGSYTIKNCNIIDYDYGIRFTSGNDYSQMINNTIRARTIGIRVVNARNFNITGNTITDSNTPSVSIGIDVIGTSFTNTGNNISHNYIRGYHDGIAIKDNSGRAIIYNNTLYNIGTVGIGGTGILLFNNSNNSVIYSNRIENVQWNPIGIYTNNVSAYNNYVLNWSHHCFDMNMQHTGFISNDIKIYNNVCENNNTIYGHVNYVRNTTNVNITGNNFTSTGLMINMYSASSEVINYTLHNNIFNYSVSSSGIGNTTTNICLGLTGNLGLSVMNNLLYNCGTGILFNSNNYSMLLENNTHNSVFKIEKYQFDTDVTNLTSINNRGTSLLINNTAKTITFNYNGLSNFNLTTDTINIFNQALAYPFNDVYNVSTSSILAQNVNNYAITLTSGQQIIVGNYSLISFNYTYPSGTLGYYVTGVQVNITNPDNVYTNSSVVLYNSAFTVLQNYTNNSLNFVTNYTILNGGTYYSRILVFTNASTVLDTGYLQFNIVNQTGKILTTPPIDPNTLAECRTTTGAMITSFLEIPSWFVIMMAVLVASIIIGIMLSITSTTDMSFSSATFMTVVIAVLISGFIYVIGIVILSSVC